MQNFICPVGFEVQVVVPSIQVLVDRAGRVCFSFFQNENGTWTLHQSRDVSDDVLQAVEGV